MFKWLTNTIQAPEAKELKGYEKMTSAELLKNLEGYHFTSSATLIIKRMSLEIEELKKQVEALSNA